MERSSSRLSSLSPLCASWSWLFQVLKSAGGKLSVERSFVNLVCEENASERKATRKRKSTSKQVSKLVFYAQSVDKKEEEEEEEEEEQQQQQRKGTRKRRGKKQGKKAFVYALSESNNSTWLWWRWPPPPPPPPRQQQQQQQQKDNCIWCRWHSRRSTLLQWQDQNASVQVTLSCRPVVTKRACLPVGKRQVTDLVHSSGKWPAGAGPSDRWNKELMPLFKASWSLSLCFFFIFIYFI